MSLPGQVPEGWKRYYFIPWGASALGGLFGAIVRVALGATELRDMSSDSASWVYVGGIVMGGVLGCGVTVVMLLKVSEDTARIGWPKWSGIAFGMSGIAAYATFLGWKPGPIWLP